MGLTKSNFYKKPEADIKEKVNVRIETSWDDGGILDLKVAELLKKYNLPGTFYIVIDWVGKPGYLNWDQIKELDKQGFNIGSHTVNHPMDLKACFDEDLFLEVQSSKEMIETVLGHNINSFCYPRGRADDRVKAKVAEAGYLEARGTGKPGITTIEDKLYLPGTIHIFQRAEYENVPLVDYAMKVIDKVVKEGGYINIWGHSAEIDKNGLWDSLEVILKYAKKFI